MKIPQYKMEFLMERTHFNPYLSLKYRFPGQVKFSALYSNFTFISTILSTVHDFQNCDVLTKYSIILIIFSERISKVLQKHILGHLDWEKSWKPFESWIFTIFYKNRIFKEKCFVKWPSHFLRWTVTTPNFSLIRL